MKVEWAISEENKLTHISLGKNQPQLSQLAEPLWTDPGLKSGIGGHREAQVGNDLPNLNPKSSEVREGHHHHQNSRTNLLML